MCARTFQKPLGCYDGYAPRDEGGGRGRRGRGRVKKRGEGRGWMGMIRRKGGDGGVLKEGQAKRKIQIAKEEKRKGKLGWREGIRKK